MSKKTPKRWEAAIAALLSERTTAAAAAKADIPPRTLRSWLSDPRFTRLLRDAQQQVVEAAVRQIQGLASDATDTLKRLMTCGNPQTEARVAVAIIEQSCRGVETGDLAQQVAELRAELEELKNHGNSYPADAGEEDAGGGGEEEGEDDADSGQAEGGPLTGTARRTEGSGSLASDASEIPITEDVTPLFATERQEFGIRSPRTP